MEEYSREEGRGKMEDVAIRIHMSKETRNLGERFEGRVFEGRRKREEGRVLLPPS